MGNITIEFLLFLRIEVISAIPSGDAMFFLIHQPGRKVSGNFKDLNLAIQYDGSHVIGQELT